MKYTANSSRLAIEDLLKLRERSRKNAPEVRIADLTGFGGKTIFYITLQLGYLSHPPSFT